MEKTHKTKPTYFKSKNNRWMKQYIDENGKSKTVFVKKDEIKNIPENIISSENSKLNNDSIIKTDNFEILGSKIGLDKERNSKFLKQYRECF